jgi:hypothetical protein
MIAEEVVERFQRGAVYIRQLFNADELAELRAGIELRPQGRPWRIRCFP